MDCCRTPAETKRKPASPEDLGSGTGGREGFELWRRGGMGDDGYFKSQAPAKPPSIAQTKGGPPNLIPKSPWVCAVFITFRRRRWIGLIGSGRSLTGAVVEV